MSNFAFPNFVLPSISTIDESVMDSVHDAMERRAGRLDAEDVFEYLMEKVEAHQKSLTKDEELGLRLANFGHAAEISIREIDFKNPNLIEFTGVNADGHRVTLVQHISQLNFMLVAVKPVDDEPYRIGFRNE